MHKIMYTIKLIKRAIIPAINMPPIIGTKQNGKNGLQKMLEEIIIVMIKTIIVRIKSLIQSTNIFFIILPPKC